MAEGGKPIEGEGAAGGSKGASAVAAKEDGLDLDFFHVDPMMRDYQLDFGIRDMAADPGMIATGTSLFNQNRTKDIPCRFHDGVSGTCWKGSGCPYGHEPLTGGRFAQEHPDLALAHETRRAGLYSFRLPGKATLVKEAEILCEITHVDDPSLFYIRPLRDLEGSCSCTKIANEFIPMIRKEEQNEAGKQIHMTDEALLWEAYCLNSATPDSEESPAAVFKRAMEGAGPSRMAGKSIDQQVDEFLRAGLNYKRLQEDWYQPHIELVAVRVKAKWRRAYVRPGINSQEDPVIIRAQLLETGETVNVPLGDVCKLPEKFVNVPTGAFKCSLFGISPVWGVWTTSCTAYFKKLIQDKNLKIIVKRVPCRTDGIKLFEIRPYSVKVMFEKEQKWIDVAEEMNKEGHGIPWNLLPKRPFANTVIEPTGLEFVSKSFQGLSVGALKIENERLKFGYDAEGEGEGVCDSENPSCEPSGEGGDCDSDNPSCEPSGESVSDVPSSVYYSAGDENCPESEEGDPGSENLNQFSE